MVVIGKHAVRKEDGTTSTTLHVADDFPAFYKQEENGRSCEGKICDSIYVGSYDCAKIPVGAEIEILYDKAIQTKTGGIFQPIREIRVVKSSS